MTPVMELILRPGGSPDAVNVIGAVPPFVVRVVAYGALGTPDGNNDVVSVGPVPIVKKQTGVPYVVPAEFIDTSW